jgi:spore maturation protein SpmB
LGRVVHLLQVGALSTVFAGNNALYFILTLLGLLAVLWGALAIKDRTNYVWYVVSVAGLAIFLALYVPDVLGW